MGQCDIQTNLVAQMGQCDTVHSPTTRHDHFPLIKEMKLGIYNFFKLLQHNAKLRINPSPVPKHFAWPWPLANIPGIPSRDWTWM